MNITACIRSARGAADAGVHGSVSYKRRAKAAFGNRGVEWQVSTSIHNWC